MLKNSIIFLLIAICPSLLSAVCIQSAKADLRKEPRTNAAVSWRVGKYMPFTVEEKKSGWVKLKDLDGEMHWAQPRYLNSQVDCLVIKNEVSMLRVGPGTSYKPSSPSFGDRFTPYRKLDREGAWLKVQDDAGTVFWVHEMNVWEPLKISRLSI